MRASRGIGLLLLAAAVALVTWLLAAGTGLPSFGAFFSSLLLLLGWLAICLAALIATVVYGFVAARRRGVAAFGIAASLLLGLVVGLVGMRPVTIEASDTAWEQQRPAREALAEELIARAQERQLTGEQRIVLPERQSWLSDGGEVLVYGDGSEACVWFWDVCGLLGDYSASIYVSDVDATAAPGIRCSYNGSAEHESGLWWSSYGD